MASPKGVIAAEWALFAIAVLLVIARLWVHISMRIASVLVSDAFLLAAVASALGLVIGDTITFHDGDMSDFNHPTKAVAKVRFAANYFFDVGLYFPKFSMLAFYFRIIPPTAVSTRRALYYITAFVISSSLVTLFADTFWCGADIGVNWSLEPGGCTVFTSLPLAKINWGLNITAEIFIFVLPLPLIGSLQMHRRPEKLGVVLIFMLGAVTILVSCARFTGMAVLSNNIAIYVLATAEICISIMILSLISLRPLVRKLQSLSTNNFQRLTSKISTSKSNTSRKGKSSVSSWATQSGGTEFAYLTGISANLSGSGVDLPDPGPGEIYKTKAISIVSRRGSELARIEDACHLRDTNL